MTYPTSNTTGLHPTEGFILAEFLELPEDDSLIKIPDKFKSKQPDESRQRIIVLEDSRPVEVNKSPNTKGFLPGTRILTTHGDGIMHKGRKLLLIKVEEVKGWFDTAE